MSTCALCEENYKRGSFVSFHKFPKDDHKRCKWLEACDLDEWEITETSKLCSKHFTKNDFESSADYRRTLLKATAVPSQGIKKQIKPAKRSLDSRSASASKKIHNPVESHSALKEEDSEELREIIIDLGDDSNSDDSSSSIEASQNKTEADSTGYVSPFYQGDIKTESFATPNLAGLQTQVTLLQNKVKNLQRQLKRKSHRIENMKGRLDELYKKKLLTKGAYEALMVSL